MREANGRFAILRTSWVFSSTGQNFVRTMLRVGQTGKHLNIVDDQIGGPTPATAIAEACLAIAKWLKTDDTLSGAYHLSGYPNVSWADFASTIFSRSGQHPNIARVPTTDYPTPAQRPLNSRLECSSLEEAFGLRRPSWENALDTVIPELMEQI